MEELELVSDLDYDFRLIVSAEPAGMVAMEIDSIFEGNDVEGITHWMPLPTTPTSQASKD